MKYKVLLLLLLVHSWSITVPSVKIVIDNKTDSKIQITVKQLFLFPCRNRTLVVEPNEKKEVRLRRACEPESIQISSFPIVGLEKFEVEKKIDERPYFTIREIYWGVLKGGWRDNAVEYFDWNITVGPRRKVPLGAPIPVKATRKKLGE